ncbi:MAG: hypothetical protein IPL59_05665 [Candidatus Competibacteraceae bacterium]|nr:hypothetical protein [Candidatus Competibacteraceae bacterium]
MTIGGLNRRLEEKAAGSRWFAPRAERPSGGLKPPTDNQWVCWRYEDRNGKSTKPPIDAKSNGQLAYAKSNDPETWSDFDTACATAARLKLEGIGLNVWENDG